MDIGWWQRRAGVRYVRVSAPFRPPAPTLHLLNSLGRGNGTRVAVENAVFPFRISHFPVGLAYKQNRHLSWRFGILWVYGGRVQRTWVSPTRVRPYSSTTSSSVNHAERIQRVVAENSSAEDFIFGNRAKGAAIVAVATIIAQHKNMPLRYFRQA